MPQGFPHNFGNFCSASKDVQTQTFNIYSPGLLQFSDDRSITLHTLANVLQSEIRAAVVVLT